MRTTIAQLLSGDATLNGLGITPDSLWAGDTDTPEQRPYIVLRWGATNPGVGPSRARTLTIWVHDHPNDYARVDAIILRIKRMLNYMSPVATEVGWITTADWVTDSDDLSDDVTHTILKTTTYTIIGSGI